MNPNESQIADRLKIALGKTSAAIEEVHRIKQARRITVDDHQSFRQTLALPIDDDDDDDELDGGPEGKGSQP